MFKITTCLHDNSNDIHEMLINKLSHISDVESISLPFFLLYDSHMTFSPMHAYTTHVGSKSVLRNILLSIR